MRGQSRRSRFLVIAALALQVSGSVLGTIGMCVDRPHTHGGIPAPDCLMHHGETDANEPGTPHHGSHHEHQSTSPDTARIACSCSADPITLLTAAIAVVTSPVSVGVPNLVTTLALRVPPSVPDVRPAPLSPPPRRSLA